MRMTETDVLIYISAVSEKVPGPGIGQEGG